MKSLSICMTIILVSGSLFAQDYGSLNKREVRKLLREERKRKVAEKEMLIAQEIEQMVQNNAFVLEADMIFDHTGKNIVTHNNLDFIVVDSLYGAIQVLARTEIDYISVDGNLLNYEKKKNKRQNSYHIEYSLQSPTGIYDVDLHIMPTGSASAKIREGFKGVIRLSGKLVPLDKYKRY